MIKASPNLKDKIMKMYLLFLLLGFSLTVNAQIKAGQEPYLTKSFGNDAIKNVEVKTSGGSIAVAGAATMPV